MLFRSMAKAIAKSKLNEIFLNGLTTLSEKAARALLDRYWSEIYLDGLEKIPDSVARILSKADVAHIELPPIDDNILSEKAQELLKRHFEKRRSSLGKGLRALLEHIEKEEKDKDKSDN